MILRSGLSWCPRVFALTVHISLKICCWFSLSDPISLPWFSLRILSFAWPILLLNLSTEVLFGLLRSSLPASFLVCFLQSFCLCFHVLGWHPSWCNPSFWFCSLSVYLCLLWIVWNTYNPSFVLFVWQFIQVIFIRSIVMGPVMCCLGFPRCFSFCIGTCASGVVSFMCFPLYFMCSVTLNNFLFF